MTETFNIPAARAEMARLRAEAANAWDFYDAKRCGELNLRAWALQEKIEAALQAGG
jgi:hypothetical protein